MKNAAKTTKIASVAAVMPIVSSKTKQIFLKTAAANAERSKEATIAAIEAGKHGNFSTELKAFVRQHEDAKVWTSRIATVQPRKLEKSVAKQIAFWMKQGYTVVNAKSFATA